MLKRFALLLTVMAALAVPASAQAELVLTNSSGETPMEVESTSTNTTITTAAGGIACGTWHTFLFTEQNENTFHGLGFQIGLGNKKTLHEGECELLPGGLPVKFTGEIATLHIEKNGNRKEFQAFAYDITLGGGAVLKCFFAGTLSVTYESESDEFSRSGTLTGSGPAGCPTSATMSGDATLTDGSGEPVTIH